MLRDSLPIVSQLFHCVDRVFILQLSHLYERKSPTDEYLVWRHVLPFRRATYNHEYTVFFRFFQGNWGKMINAGASHESLVFLCLSGKIAGS